MNKKLINLWALFGLFSGIATANYATQVSIRQIEHVQRHWLTGKKTMVGSLVLLGGGLLLYKTLWTAQAQQTQSSLPVTTVFSFAQWMGKIKNYYDAFWFEHHAQPEALDVNKQSQFPKAPKDKPRSAPISFQEFKATANEFIQKSAQFRCSHAYLNDDKQPVFTVRKEVVQNLHVLGGSDVHADIVFSGTLVDDWIKKGYLNDNLVLQNPDTRIVFLGDYGDYGNYGVDTWNLIMKLHNANPGRVVLIKGNHDLFLKPYEAQTQRTKDDKLPAPFGFKAYTDFYFNKELRRVFSKSDSDEAIKLMRKVYQELPDAYYLGFQKGMKTRYVLFCHGGLEPGYDPRPFLCDSRTNLFDAWDSTRLDAERAKVARGLNDFPKTNQPFTYEYQVKGGPVKTASMPVGFWVNSYQDDAVYKTALDPYGNGKSFEISKSLSDELFAKHSSTTYEEFCVINGHKHVGLKKDKNGRLVKNKIIQDFARYGISTAWKKQKSSSGVLEKNGVYTLAVGPDSYTGHEFRLSVEPETRVNYDKSFYLELKKNNNGDLAYNAVGIPLQTSSILFGQPIH